MKEQSVDASVRAGMPLPRSGHGLSVPRLAGYALALGMAGGAVEASFRTLRQVITRQPALWYYPEVLWMGPLSAALVYGALALVLGGLIRLSGHRLNVGRATFLLTLLTALALFRSPGVSLHPVAEVLVSLGIATALGRIAAARATTVERAIPRIAAVTGVIAVVLTAAGVSQLPKLRERRALASLPSPDPAAPSVLLIILDTVRAANLGLYGYERPTSPNLDEWASTGVVFDRVVAPAPWTLPSHATMFTGHYNLVTRTGIDRPLDGRQTTLAEVLAGAGYATAAFVGNPGYTTRASGLDRGFARYEDFPVTAGMFARSAWLARLVTRRITAYTGLLRWDIPKRAERVTDEFEQWLDGRPDRPFFVFLNYYDAHGPYDAPPPYRGRFGPPPEEELTADEPRTPEELEASVNAYDSCIAYIDDQLARVFDLLDRRGLSENTLVVVTSDHGEMFGENGQVAHTSGLYMPGLHVPLVIGFRGVLPPGIRVTETVTLRDLPATILDVLDTPGDSPIPGESLASHWSDVTRSVSESPFLSELDHYDWAPAWTPIHRGDMRSLVDGDLHYIRNGDGVEELYDAIADAAEANDLSAVPSMRADVLRLRARLDSVLERFGGARPPH
jgi:arylsulfatase A-like enzyme